MAKGFKHGAGGSVPKDDGEGLNFSVVGGTTEPEAPTENMIWVNTDTEITSWVFSATEPTEPTEGMVWFPTGTSSPVGFNALKKNGISVYPIGANQYVGGAWVPVTAKTYQNGVWVDWIEWVLRNGEFIKGSWGSIKDAGKVAEFVDGQIHLEVDGGGSATFYTTEKFNITGRKEIVFVVSQITQTAINAKGTLHFGISDTKESHTYVAEVSVETTATNEPQEFVVPITAECYGEYYIKASIIRATNYKDGMYISEIRLQ